MTMTEKNEEDEKKGQSTEEENEVYHK